MADDISMRFQSLIDQGNTIASQLPRDEFGHEEWTGTEKMSEYQSWLASAANLLGVVTTVDSYFAQECDRLMSAESQHSEIRSHTILKMQGLLTSAYQEWQHGLLRKIEHIVAAATFDDFLDHASHYHKGNKKIESSVLASAVLEDTMKRIASKHGVPATGLPLDRLIDDLAKATVFTPVRVKRLKSLAAVRNHALHAEWGKIDIKDVGELIRGVRSLLEEYL